MTSTMIAYKPAVDPERSNRGWKWVVVLGSHLSHLLIWGMIRSNGVLLVEWKNHFDTGAAIVSSVASVMSASLLLTGPVAGYLCKRYGCRTVTILGGILAALGYLLGSFAQSIPLLCIAVGGITGMGFSLAYTASAVIPGLYFNKHFALANGISCTGTGVGVMLIPPLLQILIGEYGWRGAMLVMSMVLANVCVCGAIFRPVSSKLIETSGSAKIERLRTTPIEVLANNGNHKEIVRVPSNGVSPSITTCESTTSELHLMVTNKALTNDEDTHETPPNVGPALQTLHHVRDGFRWFYKATGLHLFSKSYRFFILCVTQMQVGVCFSGVMVHIVNHVGLVDSTVTSVEASLIISIVGIGSLLARVSHGFLVDRNWLTPLTGYSVGIMTSSIAILISPAIKDYQWFAFYAAILGLGMGLNMALLRVLVKDFLGVKDLAQGIGLSAVVALGCGDLIGPLISGWLYDITGNYTISFFVMGGILFTAGPLMLLFPVLKRLDLKNRPSELTR